MGAAEVRQDYPSAERFFQFSLLGLVASGYLAVAGSGHLDLPTLVLTAAGLAARGLVILGVLRLRVSARVVTAATLAYIGFYPLDYRFISRDFLAATIHLVFFLAVVKVLTARTRRDHFYVSAIAFLELLAAALLSTNLNFFAFLGLYMLFAIAGFTSAEIRRSTEKPWKVARSGWKRLEWRLAVLSVTVSLAILSLTAGLFFLLPRTANVALRRWMGSREPSPGFADQVNLGDIGAIKLRSTPLMHVRIYNERGRMYLKWRGQTLADFDGAKWSNSSEAGEVLKTEHGRVFLVDDEERRRPGRRLLYSVTLRALDSDILFFASSPEALNANTLSVIRTAAGSYRLGTGFSDGIKYEAISRLPSERGLDPPPVPKLDRPARRQYLALPPLDGRIAALAERVAPARLSDAARARAIEQHFQSGYTYSLEMPSQKPRDPLTHFLFETRRGHCEHFASSMAVMLRAIGIPARLVTGFQSGVYNPISGQYVMRASDAHSWVEAYLEGHGWVAFDPTPAGAAPDVGSLWARLGMYLDAADTFWQDWVVGYSLDQQLSLATQMELSSRRFSLRWVAQLSESAAWSVDEAEALLVRYGPAVVVLAVAAMVGLLAGPRIGRRLRDAIRVSRVRSGEARISDATLMYSRMLAILRRRGYEKPAWYTAAEFLRTLPDTEQALATPFVEAYNELRFGGRLESAARLPVLLDRIERPRP